MGLLSGDSLQRIFGRAFSGIYEDGVLVQITKTRLPNGTLQDSVTARIPVKVQLDRVTEQMKSAEGFAATDKRVIILRDGFPLDWINSDYRLEAQGRQWFLNEVATDPARSHFEARGALVSTSPVP